EIFDRFPGPVIDSFDVRQNPKAALQALCAEIGLPWDPAMLSWSKGPRSEDGIWATHWYGAVHGSTGFAGAEGPLPEVDPRFGAMHRSALKHYEHMARMKG
ncbi:MAG: HAD family hydrolase, partial [Pseudomonadota bacterium]